MTQEMLDFMAWQAKTGAAYIHRGRHSGGPR